MIRDRNSPTLPRWNGWGVDIRQHRFQSATQAQLTPWYDIGGTKPAITAPPWKFRMQATTVFFWSNQRAEERFVIILLLFLQESFENNKKDKKVSKTGPVCITQIHMLYRPRHSSCISHVTAPPR